MPANIKEVGRYAFEESCLKEIEYLGTPEEFAAMEIGEGNEALKRVIVYTY